MFGYNCCYACSDKNSVAISHSLKVGLAIESVLGITFPLIVELFRARIRSDFFLSYLKSCREKFSKRCSSLLLSIVNGDYKNPNIYFS